MKKSSIESENKRCFCALLNPKDDMDKYKSKDYKCLGKLYPCFVDKSYMK